MTLAHYLQRIFANFSGAFSGSCIRWHNFAPPPLPRIQGGPCFIFCSETVNLLSRPPLKAAGGGAPGHHLPITCAAHSKNYFQHTPGPPFCERPQNGKSHIVHLHELRTPAKHPRRCFPHVNRAAAASGGGSRLASSAVMAIRREALCPHPAALPYFTNSSRQFCRKLARPQYDKIPGRLAPAVFRHIVNLEKPFPRRQGPRIADP